MCRIGTARVQACSGVALAPSCAPGLGHVGARQRRPSAAYQRGWRGSRRGSRGRASLTVRARPARDVPLRASMAVCETWRITEFGSTNCQLEFERCRYSRTGPSRQGGVPSPGHPHRLATPHRSGAMARDSPEADGERVPESAPACKSPLPMEGVGTTTGAYIAVHEAEKPWMVGRRPTPCPCCAAVGLVTLPPDGPWARCHASDTGIRSDTSGSASRPR